MRFKVDNRHSSSFVWKVEADIGCVGRRLLWTKCKQKERKCRNSTVQRTGRTSASTFVPVSSWRCRKRSLPAFRRVYKMHYDRLLKKYVDAVKAYQKAKVRGAVVECTATDSVVGIRDFVDASRRRWQSDAYKACPRILSKYDASAFAFCCTICVIVTACRLFRLQMRRTSRLRSVLRKTRLALHGKHSNEKKLTNKCNKRIVMSQRGHERCVADGVPSRSHCLSQVHVLAANRLSNWRIPFEKCTRCFKILPRLWLNNTSRLTALKPRSDASPV
jgi:hypothetical protein